MSKQHTGNYDVDGIPIMVGDLIRVQHFVHVSKRRMMWLYFRVARKEGKYVVQNWNCLDVSRYQCLLEHCGLSGAEVIAADGTEFDAKGNLITFNERKRIKREVANAD